MNELAACFYWGRTGDFLEALKTPTIILVWLVFGHILHMIQSRFIQCKADLEVLVYAWLPFCVILIFAYYCNTYLKIHKLAKCISAAAVKTLKLWHLNFFLCWRSTMCFNGELFLYCPSLNAAILLRRNPTEFKLQTIDLCTSPG